jgi:enoyl-CoA hydratase/carnithine racemase
MSEILVTDDGGIRTIRMNRPQKRNALTSAMYDAMADAIESADASVRCLLVAGLPDAFCAGNDLNDFLRVANTGEGLGPSILRFLHALARCQNPLVAAVAGTAVGIGTTMLLHCDYVVAGSNAKFSTPFVNLGLVPENASSLLAPRLLGQRRAFALLVMGQPMDAQEARAAGLVNVVVAPEAVDEEGLRAARTIAALPREAVMASRRLMRGAPEDIHAQIDAEAEIFKERLHAPEARAAFEAFLSRGRGGG